MSRSIQLKMAALLVIWIVAFYPVLPSMADTWLNHSDNSHALLVPFIVLYIAWRKREELRRVEVSGSLWGWLILVGSLAIYVVSYAGDIAFFARLMMVASLTGLLWCCLGGQAVRVLAFPLAFLVFMVPVPTAVLGLVSFPLQLLATKISAGMIQFCFIPVLREGNMLFFTNAQLEVAEACSGIRSIASLSMLSILFAYMFQKGWWRKAILIASAIPIALLANILRISGTGVLAHYFGDQVARGFLHEFSGMVVFALGMLVLFMELNILARIGTGRQKGLQP